MAIELTVVLRFPEWQDVSAFLEDVEDEFLCDIVSEQTEEV